MATKQTRQIITHVSPKSPEAEAFRILRTNLQFTSFAQKTQKILFTSSGPEEGKSSIVANLAVVIAQAGKKVLVVDCDLRKPVQHKIFKGSNLNGVTNALAELGELMEVVQETDVPNLFLLSCGPIPPNPSELLGSDKMSTMLEELEKDFDYIILDSPPAISVTDATLLSTKVDGTVLVVEAGNAKTDKINEVKEKLIRANARILGVVLNGVKYNKDEEYYYYYYGEEDK